MPLVVLASITAVIACVYIVIKHKKSGPKEEQDSVGRGMIVVDGVMITALVRALYR